MLIVIYGAVGLFSVCMLVARMFVDPTCKNWLPVTSLRYMISGQTLEDFLTYTVLPENGGDTAEITAFGRKWIVQKTVNLRMHDKGIFDLLAGEQFKPIIHQEFCNGNDWRSRSDMFQSIARDTPVRPFVSSVHETVIDAWSRALDTNKPFCMLQSIRRVCVRVLFVYATGREPLEDEYVALHKAVENIDLSIKSIRMCNPRLNQRARTLMLSICPKKYAHHAIVWADTAFGSYIATGTNQICDLVVHTMWKGGSGTIYDTLQEYPINALFTRFDHDSATHQITPTQTIKNHNPFGIGPRGCPGQSIGVQLATCIIQCLRRHWSTEFASNSTHRRSLWERSWVRVYPKSAGVPIPWKVSTFCRIEDRIRYTICTFNITKQLYQLSGSWG